MINLRNIFIALCLAIIPAMSSAQSSINKIVESLEDDKNVENVLYSEQRDPSTKKVVKSSRIIKFTSDKLAAKLISAFKKERENAITYKSVSQPSNTVYEMSFNDGKGFTAKYTLAQQGGTNWILSVSILHSQHVKTKKSTSTSKTKVRRTSNTKVRRTNNTSRRSTSNMSIDPDLKKYVDPEVYEVLVSSIKEFNKNSIEGQVKSTSTSQNTIIYKSVNGDVTYIRYK